MRLPVEWVLLLLAGLTIRGASIVAPGVKLHIRFRLLLPAPIYKPHGAFVTACPHGTQGRAL